MGIAASGLGAAYIFGDLVPSELVPQLQPWRALWLLTILGTAGLALAAVRLWRANSSGRVTLACLIMAWSTPSSPILSDVLGIMAVGLSFADRNGGLRILSPRIARVALGAALLAVTSEVFSQGGALVRLFGSPGAFLPQIGPWPYVLASGVLAFPILATAVAVAIANREPAQTGARAWLASLGLVRASRTGGLVLG